MPFSSILRVSPSASWPISPERDLRDSERPRGGCQPRNLRTCENGSTNWPTKGRPGRVMTIPWNSEPAAQRCWSWNRAAAPARRLRAARVMPRPSPADFSARSSLENRSPPPANSHAEWVSNTITSTGSSAEAPDSPWDNGAHANSSRPANGNSPRGVRSAKRRCDSGFRMRITSPVGSGARRE